MLMTGDVTTLYMAPGSCIDPHEVEIEAKVEGAMTFTGMECIPSADPTTNIVITGRTGTCGALADSGTFICTMVGGSGRAAAACDTGANSLSISDEQCWSLKVAPTAGITDVAVNCTLKRSS
jgi:hypothetical protein